MTNYQEWANMAAQELRPSAGNFCEYSTILIPTPFESMHLLFSIKQQLSSHVNILSSTCVNNFKTSSFLNIQTRSERTKHFPEQVSQLQM